MKKVNGYRYVEHGATRYVIGDVKHYNQKNEMFKRPFWDPQMLDLGKQFYQKPIMPTDEPGFQLHDHSVVNAAWRLENEFAQSVMGGRMGLYDWSWDGQFKFPRVPAGLKVSNKDPELITQRVKKAAAFFGASLVGICELDRRWLYSQAYNITLEGGEVKDIVIPDEIKYVIVIAIEMDYAGIQCSPANPASAATGFGYSRMAFTAGLLAQFIRGLGYQALPCGNDTACSIPIAIDAGLGEMARNGLLVTPLYGTRVRLVKLFTDLPLVPDRPIEFGVWDFCMICEKCAQKCPSQSIPFGSPTAETHNISNREGVMACSATAVKEILQDSGYSSRKYFIIF
jgi:hypothetical protein